MPETEGAGQAHDTHEPGDPFAEFAEFTAELRALAEEALQRVEPVLRHAAADDHAEWDNCRWCPVCAGAAALRGERHDLVTTIAEQGVAIVTTLREALSGAPVDPVMPEDDKS